MAELVYTLCALTSVGCAVLLQRGWRRSRVRLLMWSAACFWLLAVNNVLLFVDEVLRDEEALAWVQAVTGAAGPLVLLGGLIWDSTRTGER